jgi:hypothetical protein
MDSGGTFGAVADPDPDPGAGAGGVADAGLAVVAAP